MPRAKPVSLSSRCSVYLAAAVENEALLRGTTRARIIEDAVTAYVNRGRRARNTRPWYRRPAPVAVAVACLCIAAWGAAMALVAVGT